MIRQRRAREKHFIVHKLGVKRLDICGAVAAWPGRHRILELS